MSAMSAIVEKAHELWAEAEAAGDSVAEKLKAFYHDLIGDAPEVEAEVKTDAEHVATTAETEGIKPAEVDAVADAVKVGDDVVHDVKAAVTEAEHPVEAAPASETPAAPTV